MKKYQHGGDVYSNKTEYDFSANINPLGMPESVKIKLRESIEMCEHYPDTESRELIREIALRCGRYFIQDHGIVKTV